jgi:ATP-dependent DNA helicase RecQ
MDKAERERNQQAWMTGKVRMIVCTNAFGMGIDKSDVRLVIHLDVPPSLEEYYQEAGRAGRDGKESLAVALISPADLLKAAASLEEQYPSLEQITFAYEKLCRYFKVAYGAGEQESYDFSMQEFAGFLSFPVKKVFHLIQILEKEGWIALSEGLREPSRIWVLASREDLLNTEQYASEQGQILVQLLRSYEGLFSGPVKIDEARLARSLGMEESKLIGRLHQMQAEGLVAYYPRADMPRITFLRPRPTEGHFTIDKNMYLLRKKQASAKLAAVIHYFEKEESCRQQAILTYFGEKSGRCGKCDLCLGSLQSRNTQEAADRVWNHLKASCQAQTVFIKPYLAVYPVYYRRRIQNLLRYWATEGMVRIDNQGKITLES